MKFLLALFSAAAAIQLQPRSAKRAALTPTRRGLARRGLQWLPVAGWLAARRPAAAEDFESNLKALYKVRGTLRRASSGIP